MSDTNNMDLVYPLDLVQRLQNFDPQPIEPGYLGEEIATLMDRAAAVIEEQAKAITDLKGQITDLMYALENPS